MVLNACLKKRTTLIQLKHFLKSPNVLNHDFCGWDQQSIKVGPTIITSIMLAGF